METLSLTVVAVLAGLLIGSFLNVCVFRLPRDLSVVRPRSFCPRCEKTIAWYDNIPLLSFVLLRRRCRHCRERIPVRYPLVEAGTAAAFAICVLEWGPTLVATKWAIFSAILIALIATDLEERILPDEFTLGGTLVGLLFSVFVPMGEGLLRLFLPPSVNDRWVSVSESVAGAVAGSGLIWLMGWLYEKVRHREGLGLGDVKMLAMLGAFAGFRWALLILMAASLAGSIVGLLFVWLAKKDAKSYELPFGSFLGLTGLILAVTGRLAL